MRHGSFPETFAMKLGEIFIQKGIISTSQLGEALHAQLIYGGHLGTCLVELGYVDEDQLGSALSEVFKVPFATADRLSNIPRSVIRSVPAKLVEKLNAIPFERHVNKISIAMIDPTDLPAIDEMSFATGCRIIPCVAPEVRIAQAMERYYGIQRRLRYITVCNELDRTRQITGEHSVTGVSRSSRPAAVGVTSTAPRSAPSVRVGVMDTLLASPDSTAVDMAPGRPGGQARPASPVDRTNDQGDAVWSPVKGISDLLCGVECADAAIETALDYASRSVERCMLFTVSSTTAVVRSWRRLRLDRDRVRSLGFCITEEPVFQLFLGDGFYRGPLPREACFRGIHEALGVEPPSEILVIPTYLEDRLVAIFYGDSLTGSGIEGDTEDYRRLVRKLAIALSIIILKRRLRSV
jgi:hypothetical protein